METEPVTYARVSDSRIDIDAPKTLVAYEGPSSVTYQVIQASNPASTTPSFDVQTPSYNTGVGRRILYTVRGTITITGTNLDQLQIGNRVALRSFPLTSCMTAQSVDLNDTTLSLGSVNQYVAGLTAIARTSKSVANGQSTVGTAPDLVADYEDAVAIPRGPFEPPAAGPYDTYAAGSRTIGLSNMVVAPGNASATIDVDISEPLIISPLAYGEDSLEKAIYGVNRARFNWTLTNFHRMLSIAVGPLATIATVNLVPTFQALEVSFVTPKDSSLISRERPFSYNNVDVQLFSTELTNAVVAPGAQVTGSSATVELATIPNQFLVFATISETDRQDPTQSFPDIFLPIQSCQVQFGTRAGLLASATPRHLWEISQRNGINLPFPVWSGQAMFGSSGQQGRGAGGPLLLDAAADLSLPTGVVPGMNQRIQLAFTSITVENNASVNLNGIKLVVLALTDGVVTNMAGSTVKIAGGIPMSVGLSPELAEYKTADLHRLKEDGGYGGRHSKAARFFRSVARGLKKAFGPVSAVASALVPELAIPLAAANVGLKQIGGATMGGAEMGGAPLGGTLLGGGSGGSVASRIRGGRRAPKALLYK